MSNHGGLVLTTEIAERYLQASDLVPIYEYVDVAVAAAATLARTRGCLNLSGLTSLSDASAEALAAFEGWLNLSGLTSLSVAAARSLAKHQGDLSLNGLTSISEDVARALAQHQGWLSLNGLVSLSDSAARELAGHQWLSLKSLRSLTNAQLARKMAEDGEDVYLDSLTELSAAAARSLASHQGGDLFLNGLTELSDESAEALSQHRGYGLHLDGLTAPTAATLNALTRYRGQLHLRGLKSLPDAPEALVELERSFCFQGVTTVSDVVAGALARFRTPLYLDGVSSLSTSVAERLSRFSGTLSLNGLKELDAAAAAGLAKHQGKLLLNGLTQLCCETAQELAQHRGALILNGLQSIDVATAMVMSEFPYQLSLLGLVGLSEQAATAIGKARKLNVADEIKATIAEAREKVVTLREAKREYLSTIRTLLDSNSFENFTQAIALLKSSEILQQDWKLILGKSRVRRLLKTRSPDIWNVLLSTAIECPSVSEEIRRQAEHLLNSWDEANYFTCCLLAVANEEVIDWLSLTKCETVDFDDTTLTEAVARRLGMYRGPLRVVVPHTLSDSAAESLSRHRGHLVLHVQTMSDAAAENLCKHQGPIFVHGLTSLTNVSLAGTLAKSDQDLHLNSLTTISDFAARAFAKHSWGSLFLNGLAELSDGAAQAISQHQGCGLYLNGLQSLTELAADALGKYVGTLRLGGLTTLSDTEAESLRTHQGHLSLNGLTTISDAAVESLSKHQGGLDLSGLTTLSDAAAESLSKHQDRLQLFGLRTLSDAAVESLHKIYGWLDTSEHMNRRLLRKSVGRQPAHSLGSKEERVMYPRSSHRVLPCHPQKPEIVKGAIITAYEEGYHKVVRVYEGPGLGDGRTIPLVEYYQVITTEGTKSRSKELNCCHVACCDLVDPDEILEKEIDAARGKHSNLLRAINS